MTVSEQLSSLYRSDPTNAARVEKLSFPIIGIGASAGGIPALGQFFTHMPADSGMAFVVILHLSPAHESEAAAVLQSYTSMSVTQVTAPVAIEPNHAYVIPPARQLSLVAGMLRLAMPADEHARHTPINQFFHTLAATHGPYAAAIVLSGMGADGALGVQQIKDHGGVTLAQAPEESEYDMMPRSAIATGRVDFVLPVAQMPARLIDYWRMANTGQRRAEATPPMTDTEVISAIRALLGARTGYDFRQLAEAILRQRIERRMQAHDVAGIEAYVAVLRARPDEVQALLRELLAAPSDFFKPAAVSDALAATIPALFTGKTASAQVRVWVAGCGTGEEAYSVAILLHEYASTLDHSPAIQVFATDINEQAIHSARQGLFPEAIADDVPPERLQRFFAFDQCRYRITKELRDLVLFAQHNLLHDPPFSKLDLIVCRNRLRYLTSKMQEQVLRMFHFILEPGGYLLLGAAESTDCVADLFVPMQNVQNLFQRHAARDAEVLSVPTVPLFGSPAPFMTKQSGKRASGPSFSQLHQQLLLQYGPPSVIVDKRYTILNLSGTAGRFLTLNDGEPSRHLLQLIHPDLQLALRVALLEAVQQNRIAKARRVPIELNGSTQLIDMVVHPVQEPEWARGCLMVVFHDQSVAMQIDSGSASSKAAAIQQPETELLAMKAQLHAMVEQYETSVEKHRAANEDLQALNEELRVMTEELRGREEDLQAVNQELISVNQELKRKVEEISKTNNDLLNLMASTQIGTIFVDRDLRIKRYTPSAQAIFNLLPTDINRPLASVTHRLAYDQIIEDAASVLETLTKIEREVFSEEGCCYLARLLPYRTLEDTIEGVILTFVDITERKQADQRVQFQAQLLDSVEQAVIATDTRGMIIYWNRFAERLYGWTAAEALGQSAVDLLVPETSLRKDDRIIEHLQAGTPWAGEYILRRRDGSTFPAFVTDGPIRDETGRLIGVVGVSIDISVPKQTEADLHQALAEVHAARDQLQALSRRLLDVQEAERRTIARELHDEIGQDLTGLSLRLLMIDPRAATEAIRTHVQAAQRQVNHIMAQVRQMSLDLRPPMLDDLGLLAALQWHSKRYTEQTNIHVIFEHNGLEQRRFAVEVEITAYRVVQEALTNVARYAGVNTATVRVWVADEHLHVQIADQGRGFNTTSKLYSSSGLSGMRERVHLLQGTLEITSAPDDGTCIHATLPLLETAGHQEESNERAVDRAGR